MCRKFDGFLANLLGGLLFRTLHARCCSPDSWNHRDANISRDRTGADEGARSGDRGCVVTLQHLDDLSGRCVRMPPAEPHDVLASNRVTGTDGLRNVTRGVLAGELRLQTWEV